MSLLPSLPILFWIPIRLLPCYSTGTVLVKAINDPQIGKVWRPILSPYFTCLATSENNTPPSLKQWLLENHFLGSPIQYLLEWLMGISHLMCTKLNLWFPPLNLIFLHPFSCSGPKHEVIFESCFISHLTWNPSANPISDIFQTISEFDHFITSTSVTLVHATVISFLGYCKCHLTSLLAITVVTPLHSPLSQSILNIAAF